MYVHQCGRQAYGDETESANLILEACQIMDKARAWFGSDLHSLPALTQKLMGDMDVRRVMHVLGFNKKVKTRKQYPNLEAIAQDFAKELQDAGGD